MIPQMVTKASSNVEAVGYDEPTGTLFIRYRSGLLYRYECVPKETAAVLIFADVFTSVGQLVNTMIKGSFSFSQACPKCGATLAKPHECSEVTA